jgi:hypothetical protein
LEPEPEPEPPLCSFPEQKYNLFSKIMRMRTVILILRDEKCSKAGAASKCTFFEFFTFLSKLKGLEPETHYFAGPETDPYPELRQIDAALQRNKRVAPS